jgi:hypothetical protein
MQIIFDRSVFAPSIRFQNVYSRPSRSMNRRDTGQKPNFRRHRPSLILSKQSWTSRKSRHRITSSGISHMTDQSRNYPTDIAHNYIVDHAYFGWESGSPILRDRFTVAQIRPQSPLDAGLLWVSKRWWRTDERLDHHS